jgi:preprotein translocase subunit SecA
MNKQREVIYSQRRKVLEGENLKQSILVMIEEVISNMVDTYCVEGVHPEEWDLKGLIEYAEDIFLPRNSFRIDNPEEVTREELKQRLVEKALALYELREKELGSDTMREFERVITLKIVDKKWMDHIDAMDQLRQGIGLRAYGQSDPVIEYKFEGYEMFKAMIRSIQEDTVKYLFKAQVQNIPQRHQVVQRVSESRENTGRKEPVRNQKVGRNDPCPCGSGKKYKKCCGR